jgi:hypothetical protein
MKYVTLAHSEFGLQSMLLKDSQTYAFEVYETTITRPKPWSSGFDSHVLAINVIYKRLKR